MKKRLLAGLLATSIALSISMGAFPAMAATNDDFVEDREDIADFTDDSYSSGYSSSEQLFDDIIFFDLDEEVDDTAAEVIAEEDANDSSDTEIDRAADSIEETEPEDEVQNTDAAEDRNDREYPDEETKSGTNPGEAGPSDAETEEDVPDSWEETPKIDSELEAAIASEDPFSYYDDDASEEEMDDDIALLAAGKTMAHEDYAYTDVSSGTEYMVDLYTDHTAKIWKLTTSSGEAECILPSTIYYTDDDDVPEPTPYTVTELRFSPYGNSVTSVNNNYTALVLPDTLTDIGGSLSGFKIERSDAGGFIITNTYERPLYPEPIEPIDPIPPVDPPQEEIVTPPIVPGTTGNEPNPPSTEETTSVPPTEPTEESTDESTEERSAESDPEESPIKETQETPSVSANPPKLIQTGQTWWPVFLLMFAGAGLLVFGLYKRSKENIDHE